MKLIVVYASPDGSEASAIPIPLMESKNPKPWKAATKTAITAMEADATEKAYQSSPVVLFEFVTVTL